MKNPLPSIRSLACAAGLLSLATGSALTAEPFIWIEGEAPDSANLTPEEGGYKLGPLARTQWQSGGALLYFALKPDEVKEKWPEEGFVHGYDFRVEEGGAHEFWARIGYEFARSPFEWRIDGGEWQTVDRNQATVDLVELSTWNQIGWLWIDNVELTPGEHSLEFRHRPATDTDNKGREKPGKATTNASSGTSSISRKPGCAVTATTPPSSSGRWRTKWPSSPRPMPARWITTARPSATSAGNSWKSIPPARS